MSALAPEARLAWLGLGLGLDSAGRRALAWTRAAARLGALGSGCAGRRSGLGLGLGLGLCSWLQALTLVHLRTSSDSTQEVSERGSQLEA